MPSEWLDRRNGADSISSHQTVTRGRSTKAPPGSFPQLDNASGDAHPLAAPIARGSAASRPPGIRSKADFLLTRQRATRLERVALRAFSAGKQQPYGGSGFFNCAVISDVSAATSGAMVQAAIANNISMIARVKALTLAAR